MRQQRVLGLIFGQPGRSFYATELIGPTGAGSGAVQRELARLAQSGLVTMHPLGNQKHYRANPDSPIYAELCGIAQKTVGLAEPLREVQEKGPGPFTATPKRFTRRPHPPAPASAGRRGHAKEEKGAWPLLHSLPSSSGSTGVPVAGKGARPFYSDAEALYVPPAPAGDDISSAAWPCSAWRRSTSSTKRRRKPSVCAEWKRSISTPWL